MILAFLIPLFSVLSNPVFFVPIEIENRQNISQIQLTEIGKFGVWRRERPNVPAHFHTGIDIKRPNNNYSNQPIYPVTVGKVISIRRDGPFANIIVEHSLNNQTFWTLYEHIAGIKVKINENVHPLVPIARFMNKEELNKFGWQFNHFHLEILKEKPIRINPTKKLQERFYNSYSLICFSHNDLNNYYYNPIEFISNNIQ